ncbi:MAG: efflux RND transporter periplasmic adaptor subunit [Pirellulaceae bacterium]|nr:efflux RND transporter periplasmic adaptor subunit [Pirellulaceae bacterium]
MDLLAASLVLWFVCGASADDRQPADGLPFAAGIPGYTEPYRRVHVACAESGIVAAVAVRVGQRVQAGDVLATLESTEQQALLELAEHQTRAEGRLEATLAEARLRQSRLDNLSELASQGYANPEEVYRARMESEVADAHVRAAREERVARALEFRKIQAQLDNRTIRAPLSGVLTEILKRPGEFVSYNDPNVLVLVELDRLLATFYVPAPRAVALTPGRKLPIRFAPPAAPMEGTVEVVSPVTDAESGTVRVQLVLDNSDGGHRAGERCSLELSP